MSYLCGNLITMQDFIKRHNLTEGQFLGKEEISSLYLSSLTSIPEGFNKEDYQRKEIPFMSWGKYIYCDDRFSEIVSKKGNLWRLKDIGKNNEYFLVTDNKGKYAHGDTIKEAKADLLFKISSRNKNKYEGIDVEVKMSFSECIEMYRVITGACAIGTKNFVESKGIKQTKYSPKEICNITIGAYGNSEFKSFFNL